MLFFTVVSALIAAVAAAPNFPVEDSGLSSIFRRSTCSGLPTTTVNDATLTGPFRLRARSTDASLNGNYARAPFNATLAYVVFGIQNATPFYLNADGNLVTFVEGEQYTAYEPNAAAAAGDVSIGNAAQIATAPNTVLSCTITSRCALQCTVESFSYNCLASPKYAPEWRIAGPAERNKANCVPFTPIVYREPAGPAPSDG